MTASMPQTLGVDISKESLDVHLYPDGRSHRFANDRKGWRPYRKSTSAFTSKRSGFWALRNVRTPHMRRNAIPSHRNAASSPGPLASAANPVRPTAMSTNSDV